MATMYFIQNCLKRVLHAPCDITNSNKRVDDIAEAIRIANNESIEDAHKYLVALVTEAEAGKYASQQSLHPTPPIEPVNYCNPVNGVHAPFCTGHETAGG